MKNKRSLRVISLLLLLVLVTSLLVACGSEPDPHAGLYEAESADMMGLSISVKSAFPDGISVELKDGGKCRITVGDQSASGKWTLEGEEISISGGGVELEGTLIDDTIRCENVMDSGVNLNFVKQAG